jgi:hypothetical protein
MEKWHCDITVNDLPNIKLYCCGFIASKRALMFIQKTVSSSKEFSIEYQTLGLALIYTDFEPVN